MPPVWIRPVSTAVLTLGLALVAVGVANFAFGGTHVVAAPTDAQTRTAGRTNPDEVLRDEALEVRRRVAEYREHTLASPPPLGTWKVYLMSGLALTLLGAVGRLAADRNKPVVAAP